MPQSLNEVQMHWSSLLVCAAYRQHTHLACKTPRIEQDKGCAKHESVFIV